MENIDFLCINCQELISVDRLTTHSLFCVYPSEAVLEIDKKPLLSQYIYKLHKLKSALLSHITENLSEIHKEFYEFLISQASSILTIENPTEESIETCKTTAKILERYSKTDLSTSLLLYNERLKLIAIEASKILEKDMQDIQINSNDLKYKEIQVAKEKVMKGNIENGGNIEEISSQISQIWNNRPSISSFSAIEEEHFADVDDLDKMFKQQEKEQGKQNIEDLQRYFFSKCLLKKISCSPKDPAQYIQVPELFKSVIELKLPVDKWEAYIEEQFQHPERWLNTKLIS